MREPSTSPAIDGRHYRVAVVGAGFSGLGAAIMLGQRGVRDYVVLERGDDVGGTWRDNDYPGAACDVPSHLYSFSFAPNPGWSRSFSGQREILDYLRDVAGRYGVRPHVRFGCEMHHAAWDEGAHRWNVATSHGTLSADVLVAAGGALSEPSRPRIPGLDTFAGTTFHSAQWDHSHDLDGRRVAVIGTGASAIQFVPEIAPNAEHVHVFQRTPPWVIPQRDRALTRIERRVFAALPAVQRAVRAGIYWGRESYVLGFTSHRRLMRLAEKVARRHLRRQVTDPALRAKLTPDYAMGCKRILISDHFYPALTRPDVELVTEPIREVTPTGVVTVDGRKREVHTIIFGTGFHVTDMPIAERLRGRDGRSLADVWQGSPRAYVGTTVAGFPNLFMLMGPNTGLGHSSQVFMIEAQLAYVRDALRQIDERGLTSIDVRQDVQDAYNEELQASMRGTVWTAGGCGSWYLDHTGRNTTLWPGFTWRFRSRTRRCDLADYVTTEKAPQPAGV